MPGVSVWLERGAEPEAIARVLSADLPAGLRRPGGLLAYRLAELLPPYPPPVTVTAPASRPFVPPDPWQDCDGCKRVFRAPEPGGRCRDCRDAAAPEAAA